MVPRALIVIPLAALCCLAPAASAQVGAETNVVVQLRQFGVGNAFRPGEVTAIQVSLTSGLDEAVPCWVQWEVPNAEGDVAEYGRSVTLSPGTPALVWLYAPLPPNATPLYRPSTDESAALTVSSRRCEQTISPDSTSTT